MKTATDSLVNRAAIKRFILKKMQALRPHMKISRVSQEAIDRYEFELRAKIINDIQSHPTIGKTFKP